MFDSQQTHVKFQLSKMQLHLAVVLLGVFLCAVAASWIISTRKRRKQPRGKSLLIVGEMDSGKSLLFFKVCLQFVHSSSHQRS